jgi:hypothetical protein
MPEIHSMASPYSGCALCIYSGAICPLLCMLPLYIHRAPSGISLCFVCCRLGSQRRIVIVAATSKMQPHTHAHLCVLSALCILRVIWLLLCVYACAFFFGRLRCVCCILCRSVYKFAIYPTYKAPLRYTPHPLSP